MIKSWTWSIVILFVLSACTAGTTLTPTAIQIDPPTATQEPAPDTPTPLPAPSATSIPPSPTADTTQPEPTAAVEETVELPLFFADEFRTDFSTANVPLGEILTLIPKDSIPALNDPQFVSVEEANTWLAPFEPVIFFQIGEDARAYPLQILTWHEIVNDVVDEKPVVITFCPLCNTAIAFDRTVNGQVLDFGTSGRLRFSNLIMYDRQTDTWWQQASGEGIIGELTGTQLEFLPAPIIGWEDFKESHPAGLVLSRETGFPREYGINPYEGYDDVRKSPFAFRGPETPGKLPAMARVLTLDLNGEAVAYPYRVLSEVQVVNDQVGGQPVVVLWEEGAQSALDQTFIANSRDVGAANSFSATLDGQELTFKMEEGQILDEDTGSQWNVLGEAIAGPRLGEQLEPVVGINHFWFSWAAFKPETRVYETP